jgi:predicted AAA+ superfamily ATPase
MNKLITRQIEADVTAHLIPGKVVVIYGARQTGKTTLSEKIVSRMEEELPSLRLNGDLASSTRWFSSKDLVVYGQYLSNIELLFIDEAQRFEEIGLILKIIVDHFPSLRVLATGSSSFDLANQVGEPLVGRKWQYTLFPLSVSELLQSGKSHGQLNEELNHHLVFGMFPEIVKTSARTDRIKAMHELVDNQLYRDILQYKNLRKSSKLLDLLKLLAWQIGKEVSVAELGKNLRLNNETVFLYLDLLEKVFLIRRVGGYSSGNLRKEVSKNNRYYFLDNGMRNAVVDNFTDLSNRGGDEVGMLWENFLFMERVKWRDNNGFNANEFFWRTYDRQEIDLVELRDGKLSGFEFKFSDKKAAKAPSAWEKSYPSASYQCINRENYLSWLTASRE